MRPEPARKSLLKRASFSKAIPRCPESDGLFPGRRRRARKPKSRRNPAAFLNFRSIEFRRLLEPFGASAAVIPARPAIAVAAIAIAVRFMVPPALVAEMREELEATLLAVVKGLVERIGRIRDALQRGRGDRHPVGPCA